MRSGYEWIMKPILWLTAAALLFTTIPAAASSLSGSDAAYLKNAMQVQLGRYALATVERRHGSGTAKKLAESIAKQAARDTRELDSLAKRYGVAPPKGPTVRDTFHYSELSGMSGAVLNRGFAMDMRLDDRIVQSGDKQEMQSGGNAALKAYAKRRYSSLQKELKALTHV